MVQQSLPSADPLTGGHLPWADIFPMYELLSNLIQPLMNGHLLNADRDSAWRDTVPLFSGQKTHKIRLFWENNFQKN